MELGTLNCCRASVQQTESLALTRDPDFIWVTFIPETSGTRADTNSIILNRRLQLPCKAWCYFPPRDFACLYIKQFFGIYPAEFTELLAPFPLSACLRGVQASKASGTNWAETSAESKKCLRLCIAWRWSCWVGGQWRQPPPGHPTWLRWESKPFLPSAAALGTRPGGLHSSGTGIMQQWGSHPCSAALTADYGQAPAVGAHVARRERVLTLCLNVRNVTFETLPIIRRTSWLAGGKYMLLKHCCKYWNSA